MSLFLQDRETGHRPGAMVSVISSSRMKAPISRFSSTLMEVKTLLVWGTKPMPLCTRAWGRESGDVLAVHHHLALAQIQHAEDGFHGGGFASAVGTDDDSNFALFNTNGAVMSGCRHRHSRRSCFHRSENSSGSTSRIFEAFAGVLALAGLWTWPAFRRFFGQSQLCVLPVLAASGAHC